jgi:DedD protein
MLMDIALKKRLLGAAVLVSLAVIFLPMLLSGTGETARRFEPIRIPPRPPPIPGTARIPEPLDLSAQPIPSSEERDPWASSVPSERAAVPPVTPDPPSSNAEGAAEEMPGIAREAASAADRENDSAPPRSVPEPLGDSEPLSAWVIQLASFSTEKKALALRDKLRERKYAAFIESAEVDKRRVYRVRVGPELERKRALLLRERLGEDFKDFNLRGQLLRHP